MRDRTIWADTVAAATAYNAVVWFGDDCLAVSGLVDSAVTKLDTSHAVSAFFFVNFWIPLNIVSGYAMPFLFRYVICHYIPIRL